MGEPEPIDSFLPDPRDLPPSQSHLFINPPAGGFEGPLAGTLGGDGYGEYPLGSAGPRVDPSDPNYRLPPRDAGAMPELPDFNFNTSNIPTPENVSTSFMPGSGMGRIGQGVATDREGLMGATLFGQKITPESFAGRETAKSPFFRATPRPDLPTPNISGPFGFIKNSPTIDERPMIPSFGNINLR
jgi:hypothetical protein